MASITFYGKANCINNNKQKALLRAAGHIVYDKDILSQNWTAEQLRFYFGDTPVTKWFNIAAPAIKSCSIAIDTLTEEGALAAMIHDSLLIRRPLMEIEGQKICGFDVNKLDAMIGLTPIAGNEQQMESLKNEDITTCPLLETDTNCDQQTAR